MAADALAPCTPQVSNRRSQSMTPIFNTNREYPRMHVWCKLQPESVMSYHEDKPNYLFWVKMAKMTLKVKVIDPHFQYQLRVSKNACLVQILWLQPKFVMSYRAGKVYGQMVRRRDTGNDNTPERSRCSKMHYISMILVSKGSDYLIYTPWCGRTGLFISLLPLSLAHKLMIYL